MKITNILLGIITLLLFLNLTKGTSISLFSEANAQQKIQKTKTNDEIINVRIVGVDNNAVMNITTQGNNLFSSNPIPVVVLNGTYSYNQSKYNWAIPIFQTNK